MTVFSDPKELMTRRFCLHAVSKHVEGKLKPGNSKPRVCAETGCKTLRQPVSLQVATPPFKCDSEFGKRLEKLVVKQLFVAFETDNATDGRGVHSGRFLWSGPGLVVEGTMTGTVNANTARKPVESNGLASCFVRGLIEGQLSGSVVEDAEGRLKGSTLVGQYRLRALLSPKGLEALIGVGTFEGELLEWCTQ
jgi:hypothetical protein